MIKFQYDVLGTIPTERGHIMKKTVVSLAVLISMIFALALPFYAAAINLSTEIDGILNHYTAKTTSIEDWNEIVAFSSVNAVKGSALKEPELNENDPVTLAKFILSRLALNIKPNETSSVGDPVAKLASKQKEDGSFYGNDLYGTVLCALALQGAQTKEGDESVIYSAKQATRHILSLQKESGAFSENMKTHALCITYISAFTENNDDVARALDKAAKFIGNKYGDKETLETAATEDIAFAIAALVDSEKAKRLNEFAAYGDLPSVLVSRKNSDGIYRATAAAADSDKASTLAALIAYDALSDGKSVWRSLEDYGGVNENMWEKLKWFALGFGALVLLSIIFWFYIMFGRKKYRDDAQGAIGK